MSACRLALCCCCSDCCLGRVSAVGKHNYEVNLAARGAGRERTGACFFPCCCSGPSSVRRAAAMVRALDRTEAMQNARTLSLESAPPRSLPDVQAMVQLKRHMLRRRWKEVQLMRRRLTANRDVRRLLEETPSDPHQVTNARIHSADEPVGRGRQRTRAVTAESPHESFGHDRNAAPILDEQDLATPKGAITVLSSNDLNSEQSTIRKIARAHRSLADLYESLADERHLSKKSLRSVNRTV